VSHATRAVGLPVLIGFFRWRPSVTEFFAADACGTRAAPLALVEERVMNSTRFALLKLAGICGLLAFIWACDIDDGCDPEFDPNCGVIDPDAGGTDTTPDTGPEPDPGAFRYVYIYDLSADLRGDHPGADIDAIEVVRGGSSSYGVAVTDRIFDPTTTSVANDQNQLTGQPRIVGGAHACDFGGTPHWYSLAGGSVVIDLGANGALRDGDEIIIYECSGSSVGLNDSYGVGIGTNPRLDGLFYTVFEDAVGTFRTRLNFGNLGI